MAASLALHPALAIALHTGGTLSPLAASHVGATGLTAAPNDRLLSIDYRALPPAEITAFDIAAPRIADVVHRVARFFRPSSTEPFRPLMEKALRDRAAYAELRALACFDERAERALDVVSRQIMGECRLFSSHGTLFFAAILYYLDHGYVIPANLFGKVFQQLFDASVEWELTPFHDPDLVRGKRGEVIEQRFVLVRCRLDRDERISAGELFHRIVSGPWPADCLKVVDNGVGWDLGSSILFAREGNSVVINEAETRAVSQLQRQLSALPLELQQRIELNTTIEEIDAPHPSQIAYWISPHPRLFLTGIGSSSPLERLGTRYGLAYMVRDVRPGGLFVIQTEIARPELFGGDNVIDPLDSKEWSSITFFRTPGPLFPTMAGPEEPHFIHIFRQRR